MKTTADEIMSLIQGVGVSANIANIKGDTSLRKAGVDSIEMFTVFLALEEKFSIKIPDADVDQLDTVDNIVQYIHKK